MHLLERLHLLSKGSTPVSEYVQKVKSICDELALINALLADDDLILYSLNSLGLEFKKPIVVIHAQENPIFFEKLHDKLIEHETMFFHNENKIDPNPITVNYIHANNFNKYYSTQHQNSSSNKLSNNQNRGLLSNQARFLKNCGLSIILKFCNKRGHITRYY